MKKYPNHQQNVNIGTIFLFLSSCVAFNVFAYYFISHEKYIYFWDYYYYWSKYQQLGSLISHSPAKALAEIYQSVRHDDYNLLPVSFLAPVRILFGPGRIPYILAVTSIFVIPSAILFAVIVRKVALQDEREDLSSVYFLALSTCFLFPQFWIPVLFGYPDVAGVVVILIITLHVMTKPFEEMRLFPTIIVLGILLALLIMLRRWYVFWVISFFIAFGVERLTFLFKTYRFRLHNYLPTVRDFLIMGAVSVIFFFALATPTAKRMLITNYSDIYSAYRLAGSAGKFVRHLYDYFGLFFSLLFIVSLFAGASTRKTRRFFIFIIVQTVSVISIFYTIQEFSWQHYYLFIPSMILAISVFMAILIRNIKSKLLRLGLVTGYLCVLLIQTSIVFVPGSADGFQKLAPLFSKERHYPLVRTDLPELQRLMDTLGEILGDKDNRLYVTASSTIFSDDILRNACFAFDFPENACSRILVSSHIDKRDGFPKSFLSATYVIVTKPIQYHLKHEDQRVIGILAADIMNEKGIGSSLRKLPYEFTLDNDVKIFIYKKINEYSKASLLNLQETFLNYYPDKKDIFLIDSH